MSLSLLFYDRFADAGNFGASISLSCSAALACHSPVLSFVSVCLSVPGLMNIYLFCSTWGHFWGKDHRGCLHTMGIPSWWQGCLGEGERGVSSLLLLCLTKEWKQPLWSWARALNVRYWVQKDLLLYSFSGLVFMVLRSLCAQSPAGKPWMECVHPVKALLPSCFTQSCLRPSSPWVQIHYLQVLSLECLIASEPPENHLSLLPFRYSECKMEWKLSPFTLCRMLIEKTEMF